MKPQDLILRCYAEKKGEIWQAICLDLNLAAQGDDLEDVKSRLKGMVDSYVYDALAGDDQEYADQLLARKAPFGFWVKYYWYKIGNRANSAKNGLHSLFHTKLPMAPVHP
jgi:hypothetical protein